MHIITLFALAGLMYYYLSQFTAAESHFCLWDSPERQNITFSIQLNHE